MPATFIQAISNVLTLVALAAYLNHRYLHWPTTIGIMEKLNDVVRRLTAITLILMIPTLVASHFGMNFAYMPELRVVWAYPAVLIGQVLLIVVAAIFFKKVQWL